VPISGISPTYQKTSDIVKYVDIAKTSQTNGELKFTQRPLVFGYGNMKNVSKGRPRCIRGKRAAQITANIVIASAERLMLFLHFCLNNRSIAEMNVPACPIPIHHTNVVISNAQPTVLFSPQVPIPCQTVQKIMNKPNSIAIVAKVIPIYQYLLALFIMGLRMSLVILW
jgi:hypothetical protein